MPIRLVLIFFFFTQAIYAENIFVGLKTGLLFPKNTDTRNELGNKINDIRLDDGISYGLEVGYVEEYWRASLTGHIRKNSELELGVPPNGDIEAITGEFENLAVFINGYLDGQNFLNSGKLNPFIHLGFGYSKTKIDRLDIPGINFEVAGDSDTGFGWTAGIGLGWWFEENLAIEIEYAVTDLGDWQTKRHPISGRESGEFESNDFLITLRYEFKELTQ